MKKSLTKRAYTSLFTSALALAAFATPVITLAQNYDELIGNSDLAIEGLTAQQASLYAELASSYDQVETINTQANDLLKDVAKDDKQIAELEQQISDLQTLIDRRKDILAEQARAVQISGGSVNYLNYVASSKDVSDFVGRIDVVRQMVDANKDLLKVQIADKEAVESKKSDVEKAKETKVAKMVELESLKSTLEETVANQEAVYDQLTNDLSLAQANREALVAEKTAFDAAQAAAAQEALASAAQMEASLAQQTPTPVETPAPVAAVSDLTEQESQVTAPVAETTVTEVTTPQETTTAPTAEVTAVAETVAPTSVEVAGVEENTAAPTTLDGSEVSVAPVTPETTVAPEVTETTVAPVIEGPAGNISVAEDQAAAQAEADRIAAEQAAAEQAAAEQAAADQAAAEQAAAEQAAADQAAAQTPSAPTGDLLGTAAKYLGTPYVWGGKTPSGFDCSGFVQYVFKETYGVDVGGWTVAQESAGTTISVADAQPGDLYFWGTPGSTYHVAIATGGGSFIHASEPGKPLGYGNIEYFTPSFAVRVN